MSIFTDRETAAILSALRFRQQHYGYYDDDLLDIATNGGEFDPMLPGEIDTLCEQINFGTLETRLLDYICDELAGVALCHVIENVVLGKDEIIVTIRGWDEPYTIPLNEESNSE